MNQYQAGKARAREKAIQFQTNIANGVLYSYYDIANIQSMLERLARRYGLVREFRENAII